MKTQVIVNSKKILGLVQVLTVCIIVLTVFSSCSSTRKTTAAGAEITTPSTTPPASGLKQETTDAKETIPFVVVEEMPIFPGGDSMLLEYISRNAKYPALAKANKIEGRVILRFCVRETGSVNKVSVLQSVDPELDAEAVRVAGTLPAFQPGKQGGKVVPVWYMIPVTFALK